MGQYSQPLMVYENLSPDERGILHTIIVKLNASPVDYEWLRNQKVTENLPDKELKAVIKDLELQGLIRKFSTPKFIFFRRHFYVVTDAGLEVNQAGRAEQMRRIVGRRRSSS